MFNKNQNKIDASGGIDSTLIPCKLFYYNVMVEVLLIVKVDVETTK